MPGHNHASESNDRLQRIIILTVLAIFTIVHFAAVGGIYLTALQEMVSLVVKMTGLQYS
jgi:hypothetical protein